MMSPPTAGAYAPTPSAMPTGAGTLKRPYADMPDHPSAAMLGGQLDPASAAKERLAGLPPDMQAMVMGALGADPLVASAFLAVLGPDFAPIVQEAMRMFGPDAMGIDQQQGPPGMGGAAPDQQMQMQGGAGMIPGMMGG
jgi:hypothetical protein